MTKVSKGTIIKWLALIVIAIILALIPTNEVFTGTIKTYVVITVFCIGLVALSLFPSPLIPSLLLMFAYRFIADANTIMSGWAVDACWIVICIFLIVNVLDRNGLLNRLAYACLAKTGGSYAGICIGLYLVGLILSFLGDSAVMTMIAIGYGIVHALKLEKTRAGVGIMMAAFCGLIDAGCFIFSPSSGAWFYSMAKAGSDLVNTNVGYAEWFGFGAIFIVHWLLMLCIIIFAYKPKGGLAINGKEFFRAELAKLGPMSVEEKKICAILVVLFAFLFTVNIHGIAMVFGFVGAVTIMYLPGISVATGEDIRKINFAFPIFIVACLSIGNVSNALGVGQLIVDALIPMIDTGNLFMFFLLICLLAYGLHFFMSPSAVYAALLTPLAAVTMSLPGVNNVFPLIASCWVGVTNVILPYQTTNNVVIYSFGTMSMKDHCIAFGIRSVVYIGTLCLAIPYWHLIGLLG